MLSIFPDGERKKKLKIFYCSLAPLYIVWYSKPYHWKAPYMGFSASAIRRG